MSIPIGEAAREPWSLTPVESAPCGEDPPWWALFSHHLPGEAPELRRQAQPILLIHAATLGRQMFLEPDGGFARHLLERRLSSGKPKFAVYTLDWRSSNLLFDPGQRASPPDRFRIDRVAAEDIPRGLAKLAERHPHQPIDIVAHCLGAGSVAHALATGTIGGSDPGQPRIGRIVLSTLGLFYRMGVDGWLKTSDNIMRKLEAAGVYAISPHVENPSHRWPDELESMFRTWRRTVFPHDCGDPFCDRIWFLYGGDFRADHMLEMHNQALRRHFGALPVGLCTHIIENCQRGFAVSYDSHQPLLDPAPFAHRDLLLMTGSENQVWHRDSIDRMYEWLRRELGPAAAHVRRLVFENYGHVDVWWSDGAARDVFAAVTAWLEREPTAGPRPRQVRASPESFVAAHG